MDHRQRTYRTQGVVLRRRPQGDADRILTLFTPDRGKIELIAKGIRKTTSRKAGHLESFSHVSLLIAQARTWDIITEVATVESRPQLRRELESIGRAAYVCELVDSITELHDDNRPLWDLLLITLRELERSAGLPHLFDPDLLVRWFELHLLSLTGFQPQLFSCIGSGQPLQEELNYLSIEEGGVYGPKHGVQMSNVEPIEPDVLKVLRFLQRNPWPDVLSVQVKSPIMLRIENILYRMLIIILERQLKSVDFLRKLKRI